MTNQKLKETICFTHKGINVYVRIDYLNNKISLVEKFQHDSQDNKYREKKWLFAGRGVEFIASWLEILEAMNLAMQDAKERYECELAKQSAFQEQKDIELLLMVEEDMKKTKKGAKK